MAIKSLMISLVVSIQYTSVRDTGQQLVPCLDIASRGENRTDIRYLKTKTTSVFRIPKNIEYGQLNTGLFLFAATQEL